MVEVMYFLGSLPVKLFFWVSASEIVFSDGDMFGKRALHVDFFKTWCRKISHRAHKCEVKI